MWKSARHSDCVALLSEQVVGGQDCSADTGAPIASSYPLFPWLHSAPHHQHACSIQGKWAKVRLDEHKSSECWDTLLGIHSIGTRPLTSPFYLQRIKTLNTNPEQVAEELPSGQWEFEFHGNTASHKCKLLMPVHSCLPGRCKNLLFSLLIYIHIYIYIIRDSSAFLFLPLFLRPRLPSSSLSLTLSCLPSFLPILPPYS